MGAASNLINVFGLVLLVHAVYSAHEHSLIPKTLSTPPITSQSSIFSSLSPKVDLPLDITLETLFSVLLLCVGVVLGSPELKPIEWRVWAGKLEREEAEKTKVNEAGLVGNPYRALDERVGFLDIRAQRKEFVKWVKDGGGAVTKP